MHRLPPLLRPTVLLPEARRVLPVVFAPALLLAVPGQLGSLRFLLLNALALVLALAAVWMWSAGDRARRRTAVWSLIALVIVSALFHVLVHPDRLPTDLLTVLHQGMERESIRQLDGRGAHAGPNFMALVSAMSRTPTLRTVVGLNLWLGILKVILFFAVARQSQRPLTAMGWTLLLLIPVGLYPSFSELPSNLLAIYLLVALPGWALLHRSDASSGARSVGYALLSTLTILVAATRPEMALIGGFALFLTLASEIIAPEARSLWLTRLAHVGRRAFIWLSDHTTVLVVLCLAAPLQCVLGDPGWAITSVNPFDTSFVTLLSFMSSLLLPLGFTVLLILGMIHATRHFKLFGGVSLSLLVLYRAYFAAQNGFYETFRYVTYLFPLFLLLAMFGTRELADLARRWTWPGWWQRASSMVLILTWVVLPVPGAMERYISDNFADGVHLHKLLFDRDVQRETRFLTGAVAQHPACVFVARVVSDGFSSTSPHWEYIAFGPALPFTVELADDGQGAEALLSRLPTRPACVRYYRGLDCNLESADGCEQFVAGRRLLDQRQFRERRFNAPGEYGMLRGEIMLGVYE